MIAANETALACDPVNDTARSLALRGGVLGLDRIPVSDSTAGHWAEYEIDTAAFAIGQLQFCDRSAAVAKLRAAGIAFNIEPFSSPVCRMAPGSQSDGSSIWIHQRKAA